MMPPSEDVTKPVGHWNKTVIRIDHKENKGTVEFNGKTVAEFPVRGEQWEKLIEGSKYENWVQFAIERRGHIALQDHVNKVWIQELY